MLHKYFIMQQKILAFSSSRNGNSAYLETAVPVINDFIDNPAATIAFIPFASAANDFEEYTAKVRTALPATYTVLTVTYENARDVITAADVIMVGGGNTFKLLHDLYASEALGLIKQKVNSGTPYIGWSAGSNITGATICTTNDMPIINPGSFEALAFFPFQINPHYYNVSVPGFNGETRDQRLEEFLLLNPQVSVVALPEGTALVLQNGHLQLTGSTAAFVLSYANNELVKTAVEPGADLVDLTAIQKM